jgi:hypothetical protein
MNSRATCFTLLAGIAISLFAGLPAQAQQRARVFVSVNGNDANPCSALSPCKTFQRAHDAVLAGGEISVLDTGGYGTLIISKAISIVAIGVEASIAIPSGGTGITINASASDAISLRGLIIDGTGVGGTGIALVNAQSLVIENCVVRNMTASGIALAPTSVSNITVSDTVVADNGGHGIYVQPTNTVYAVFNRVQALRNSQKGIGIFANLALSVLIDATAIDCVSAFNDQGFYALGANPGPGNIVMNALLRVFRSTSQRNTNRGIYADASSEVSVSQSHLESDGWSASPSGVLISYGDNYNGGTAPPPQPIGFTFSRT